MAAKKDADKKKDVKKTNDKPKKKETTEKNLKKKLKDFPKHMTVKEFSDETGMTFQIIFQMMQEGELYSVIDENGQKLIPSFQIGRFIKLDK